MGKTALYLVVAGLLLGAGVFDRYVRYSWANSEQLATSVDRLEQLPVSVGDWTAQEISLDEIVVQIAACEAYKSYRYTNEQTGHSVDVTVMVGLPGQMSEHTPEACYPATGFTLDRRSWARVPVAEIVGEPMPGELAKMDFIRGDKPRPERVWHGWFDGETWSRPEYPRLHYVAKPMLFRLQVSATPTPDFLGDDPEKLIDPGRQFLESFLPTLTASLQKDEGEKGLPKEDVSKL